tara:strand:+ start:469 stop:609 length:141 start_codon:yes stop_codon:yes gene_type:complete
MHQLPAVREACLDRRRRVQECAIRVLLVLLVLLVVLVVLLVLLVES